MAEVNIAYNKNDFLFNLYNNDNCDGNNNSLNCKNKTEGEKLIKKKNNYNAADERYNNLMDKYHKRKIYVINQQAVQRFKHFFRQTSR